MKRLVALFLAFMFVALSFPSMEVRADELNATITVKVSDSLGEYKGNIIITLETPNDTQSKKLTSGLYEDKYFTTQDFGEARITYKLDSDDWTLVDSKSLKEVETFNITNGSNVTVSLTLFPSETNSNYGEYVKIFGKGESVVVDLLEQLGITASNESSVTIKDYSGGKNFDFDTWHTDAMKAYETFSSLFIAKETDSNWGSIFRMAEGRRTLSESTYLDCVKGATSESWKALSQAEVLVYYDTYLIFCQMIDRGQDYYDSKFKSGEKGYNAFYKNDVGVTNWKGEGSEEIITAYKALVAYQVAYYDFYSFPYNFINDKSYAQERSLAEDVKNTEDETEIVGELTKDEIDEIKGEAEPTIASESKANWLRVFDKVKGTWFTLILLGIALVAYLIVRKKVKEKNLDDMSQDGRQ